MNDRTEVSLFHYASGAIIHSSNLPGAYATLFSPTNEKLEFDLERSSFNDSMKVYLWAFRYNAPLQANDRFVFATSDRVRVGLVLSDGVIRAISLPVDVVRGDEGKPLSCSHPVVK